MRHEKRYSEGYIRGYPTSEYHNIQMRQRNCHAYRTRTGEGDALRSWLELTKYIRFLALPYVKQAGWFHHSRLCAAWVNRIRRHSLI